MDDDFPDRYTALNKRGLFIGVSSIVFACLIGYYDSLTYVNIRTIPFFSGCTGLYVCVMALPRKMIKYTGVGFSNNAMNVPAAYRGLYHHCTYIDPFSLNI